MDIQNILGHIMIQNINRLVLELVHIKQVIEVVNLIVKELKE